MSNIDKRALRDSAESTISILENIAGFEPSDIDGDTVELRFETEDGFDTGCDVSIVDQCQKAADVVRALLDELEAAKQDSAKWFKAFEKAVSVGARYEERIEELTGKLEAAEKRIAELEALAPELKMAHLINKFYERYPLAEFKSDTERSAALGYFMAGAELQCFGEFINYAELMGDE